MDTTETVEPRAQTELERYQGALIGLAVGDAIGSTVEFRARGSFEPVTDMVGGGPFKLKPGQWTDDTSMALCLAESLIEMRGFDAKGQMEQYVRWWKEGHLSSTGTCFDIGGTVAAALQRFKNTGEPFAGDADPRTAGNGALMRLAPIAMYFAASETLTWRYAAESTRTTHGAEEAIECSQLFALQIRAALRGDSKDEVLFPRLPRPLKTQVAAIANVAYIRKTRDDIKGSGYCVESLEAALWCFATTETFAEAVFKAVNLGDDADTTAAICGQLAGAFYGVGGIPRSWVSKLAMLKEIQWQAAMLQLAALNV